MQMQAAGQHLNINKVALHAKRTRAEEASSFSAGDSHEDLRKGWANHSTSRVIQTEQSSKEQSRIIKQKFRNAPTALDPDQQAHRLKTKAAAQDRDYFERQQVMLVNELNALREESKRDSSTKVKHQSNEAALLTSNENMYSAHQERLGIYHINQQINRTLGSSSAANLTGGQAPQKSGDTSRHGQPMQNTSTPMARSTNNLHTKEMMLNDYGNFVYDQLPELRDDEEFEDEAQPEGTLNSTGMDRVNNGGHGYAHGDGRDYRQDPHAYFNSPNFAAAQQ